MIEILQSESDHHFKPKEVQSRLDDLMAAAGFFIPRADMSEETIQYGIAWSEAEEKEQPESPRQKSQYYRKILASPDPLGEGLVCGIYKTEINARARGRTARGLSNPYVKPHLSNDRVPNLIDRLSHDMTLLRQVAEELRTYNELLIRPGAPRKNLLRTTLRNLADLYVELTNQEIDPYELPHAEASRFIQFCYLAPEPYFPITTGALSKTWKRSKEEERPDKVMRETRGTKL